MAEHMTILKQCLAKAGVTQCRNCGECKSGHSDIGDGRQCSTDGGRDSAEHVAIYKREFDRSPSLAREFGDVKTYVAFKQAEDAGLVQIFRPESAAVLGASR